VAPRPEVSYLHVSRKPDLASPIPKAGAKVREFVAGSPKASKPDRTPEASKVTIGESLNLDGFGGEIETQDGIKTTLKELVDESKNGVVLFTYPKASTPGCTTQAGLFRDSYAPLTSTGYSIYGLSKDSPKANTSFKEKQNLPFSLLCNPSSSLISVIGLAKAGNGTTRGVFVVDKTGKVLASEPGGPAATVAVVKKLVESGGAMAGGPVSQNSETAVKDSPKPELAAPSTNGVLGGSAPTREDIARADVAAQVADTAEKLDSKAGEQ